MRFLCHFCERAKWNIIFCGLIFSTSLSAAVIAFDWHCILMTYISIFAHLLLTYRHSVVRVMLFWPLFYCCAKRNHNCWYFATCLLENCHLREGDRATAQSSWHAAMHVTVNHKCSQRNAHKQSNMMQNNISHAKHCDTDRCCSFAEF